MPESDLVNTWEIHARIVEYVLDAVEPGAFDDKSAGKGRTVGAQFAHIHNVRLMWLKAAAPDLLEGVEKLDAATSPGIPAVREALRASAAAVAELVRRGVESGRIKGFKPHPTAFVAYLVSHESFHQGDIGTRLTALGHPLDQKVQYGMWEWGAR